MVKKKYETQFSIYKVDYERSIKYFDEEHNIKISSYSELENSILDVIKKAVLKKRKNEEIKRIHNAIYTRILYGYGR